MSWLFFDVGFSSWFRAWFGLKCAILAGMVVSAVVLYMRLVSVEDQARFLTAAAAKLMRSVKVNATLKMKSFKLFSLRVEEFELEVFATDDKPGARISWSDLHIVTSWTNIREIILSGFRVLGIERFNVKRTVSADVDSSSNWSNIKKINDNNDNNNGSSSNNNAMSDDSARQEDGNSESWRRRVVCLLTIKDLNVECSGLQYCQILDPTDKDAEESKRNESKVESVEEAGYVQPVVGMQKFWSVMTSGDKKKIVPCIMQHVSAIFACDVDGFFFSSNMPVHEAMIQVTATKMTIHADAERSKFSDGIRGAVDMSGFELGIDSSGGIDSHLRDSTTSAKPSRINVRGSPVKASSTLSSPLPLSNSLSFSDTGKKPRVVMGRNVSLGACVRMTGRRVQMGADLDLPSGTQIAEMRICGGCDADLWMQPFLNFYENFQNADDHAVELKIARGISAAGKMAGMSVFADVINLALFDDRCDNFLLMELKDVHFNQKAFRLAVPPSITSANNPNQAQAQAQAQGVDDASVERIRVIPGVNQIAMHNSESKTLRNLGRESDISSNNSRSNSNSNSNSNSSDNSDINDDSSTSNSNTPLIAIGTRYLLSKDCDKTMDVSVGSIRFRSYDGVASKATVTGVVVSKTVRVLNTGAYIDVEQMNVAVADVNLQRVEPAFLRWLVVLQELSNELPSSRFTHFKNADMKVNVATMVFSSAFDAASPLPSADSTINELLGKGNKNINSSSSSSSNYSSRSELSRVEKSDKLVVIEFDQMVVKQKKTHLSEPIMDLETEKLIIHSTALASEFVQELNAKMLRKSGSQLLRVGTLWTLSKLYINMVLGKDVELNCLITDDFSIDFTINRNKLMSTFVSFEDRNGSLRFEDAKISDEERLKVISQTIKQTADPSSTVNDYLRGRMGKVAASSSIGADENVLLTSDKRGHALSAGGASSTKIKTNAVKIIDMKTLNTIKDCSEIVNFIRISKSNDKVVLSPLEMHAQPFWLPSDKQATGFCVRRTTPGLANLTVEIANCTAFTSFGDVLKFQTTFNSINKLQTDVLLLLGDIKTHPSSAAACKAKLDGSESKKPTKAKQKIQIKGDLILDLVLDQHMQKEGGDSSDPDGILFNSTFFMESPKKTKSAVASRMTFNFCGLDVEMGGDSKDMSVGMSRFRLFSDLELPKASESELDTNLVLDINKLQYTSKLNNTFNRTDFAINMDSFYINMYENAKFGSVLYKFLMQMNAYKWAGKSDAMSPPAGDESLNRGLNLMDPLFESPGAILIPLGLDNAEGIFTREERVPSDIDPWAAVDEPTIARKGDTLNLEQEAKKAEKNPVNVGSDRNNSFQRPYDDSVHTGNGSPRGYCMSLHMSTFKLLAFGKMDEAVGGLVFSSTSLLLDATKDDESLYTEISDLLDRTPVDDDNDPDGLLPERLILHQDAQGGYIKGFKVAEFSWLLPATAGRNGPLPDRDKDRDRDPLSRNLISISDLHMKGPLYLASVRNPSILFNNVCTTLTCLYSDYDDIQFLTTQPITTAPTKLYFALEVTAGHKQAHFTADALKSIFDFIAVLMVMLPEGGPVDPSPPLDTWDMLRYLLHGSLSLCVSTVECTYSIGANNGRKRVSGSENLSPTLIEEIAFILNISDLKIGINSSVVALETEHINLNSRLKFGTIATKKKSRRVRERFKVHHSLSSSNMEPRYERDSTFSTIPQTSSRKSVGANDSSKSSNRTRGHSSSFHILPDSINRILGIPCLKVSLQHSLDSLEKYYSHHDVYVRPVPPSMNPFDKYAHFRTKRNSIEWNLDLSTSGNSESDSILVYFNLETLENYVIITEIINNMELNQKTNASAVSPSTSQRKHSGNSRSSPDYADDASRSSGERSRASSTDLPSRASSPTNHLMMPRERSFSSASKEGKTTLLDRGADSEADQKDASKNEFQILSSNASTTEDSTDKHHIDNNNYSKNSSSSNNNNNNDDDGDASNSHNRRNKKTNGGATKKPDINHDHPSISDLIIRLNVVCNLCPLLVFTWVKKGHQQLGLAYKQDALEIQLACINPEIRKRWTIDHLYMHIDDSAFYARDWLKDASMDEEEDSTSKQEGEGTGFELVTDVADIRAKMVDLHRVFGASSIKITRQPDDVKSEGQGWGRLTPHITIEKSAKFAQCQFYNRGSTFSASNTAPPLGGQKAYHRAYFASRISSLNLNKRGPISESGLGPGLSASAGGGASDQRSNVAYQTPLKAPELISKASRVTIIQQRKSVVAIEGTNKIWGLQVQDFKLLWTNDILYYIFNYYYEYDSPKYKFKPKQSPSHLGDGTSPVAPSVAPTVQSSTGRSSTRLSHADHSPNQYNSEFSSTPLGSVTLDSEDRDLAADLAAGSSPSVVRNSMKHGTHITARSKMQRQRRSSFNVNSRPSVTGGTSDENDDQQPNAPMVETEYDRFVVIEFFNPQVNILDSKSHSSLILMLAESSLQWKIAKKAHYWEEEQLLEQKQLRKENVFLLDMQGVSTYSVPAIGLDHKSKNLKAKVHWIHTQNPNVVGPASGKFFLPQNESKFLKIIIKKIQLFAEYKYFSQVETSEDLLQEATSIDKNATICASFLDIESLECDLDQFQYLIFNNVIKNVLLQPPPKKAHLKEEHKSEEQMKNKYQLLLHRSDIVQRESQAQKIDLNPNKPRDKTKSIKDIRLNLEDGFEKLLRAISEDIDTARTMSITIGDGKFTLRNDNDPAKMKMDEELVQLIGGLGRKNHSDIVTGDVIGFESNVIFYLGQVESRVPFKLHEQDRMKWHIEGLLEIKDKLFLNNYGELPNGLIRRRDFPESEEEPFLANQELEVHFEGAWYPGICIHHSKSRSHQSAKVAGFNLGPVSIIDFVDVGQTNRMSSEEFQRKLFRGRVVSKSEVYHTSDGGEDDVCFSVADVMDRDFYNIFTVHKINEIDSNEIVVSDGCIRKTVYDEKDEFGLFLMPGEVVDICYEGRWYPGAVSYMKQDPADKSFSIAFFGEKDSFTLKSKKAIGVYKNLPGINIKVEPEKFVLREEGKVPLIPRLLQKKKLNQRPGRDGVGGTGAPSLDGYPGIQNRTVSPPREADPHARTTNLISSEGFKWYQGNISSASLKRIFGGSYVQHSSRMRQVKVAGRKVVRKLNYSLSDNVEVLVDGSWHPAKIWTVHKPNDMLVGSYDLYYYLNAPAKEATKSKWKFFNFFSASGESKENERKTSAKESASDNKANSFHWMDNVSEHLLRKRDETIEIGFTDINVDLAFRPNRNTSIDVIIQRFWMKLLEGKASYDVISQWGWENSECIVMPTRSNQEHCKHCKKMFDVYKNVKLDCIYHEDDMGNRGILEDEDGKPWNPNERNENPLHTLSDHKIVWSCCKKDQSSPGCKQNDSRGRHVCSDNMLVIRMESYPVTRLTSDGDDYIDLNILKTLELEIFPNSFKTDRDDKSYSLKVQLTEGIYKSLLNFLHIEDDTAKQDTTMNKDKDGKDGREKEKEKEKDTDDSELKTGDETTTVLDPTAAPLDPTASMKRGENGSLDITASTAKEGTCVNYIHVGQLSMFINFQYSVINVNSWHIYYQPWNNQHQWSIGQGYFDALGPLIAYLKANAFAAMTTAGGGTHNGTTTKVVAFNDLSDELVKTRLGYSSLKTKTKKKKKQQFGGSDRADTTSSALNIGNETI